MPRKDSCWIEKSGLYGTWTFTTETMTDVGYYKGNAYVVMHLMPDPMQVKSCIINGNENNKTKGCIEANNRACSHVGALDNEKETCINTETSQLEWSDVTAFFQFGFRLRTGIIRKKHLDVHTSDWLGPYNIIMAPIEKHHHFQDDESENGDAKKIHEKKDLFVSRYVNTPWTESQLQRPFASSGIFNFDSGVLEEVVGTTAINETIHVQKEWRGTTPKSRSLAAYGVVVEAVSGDGGEVADDQDNDPYAKYYRTCAKGNLQPILPKLEIHRTTRTSSTDPYNEHPNITYAMKLDYPVLSLPVPETDSLYKLWPAMKKHLGGQFPLQGPYCYGNDPNRAYAINLSYDSAVNADEAIWKAVKGCVDPWPCWKDDPKPPVLPPSSLLPDNNGSAGSYILDPKGVEFMILYAVGFLLFVSLIVNCQLANKLKQLQQSREIGGRRAMHSQHQQQYRPVPPSSVFGTPSRSHGGAGATTMNNSVPASPNDYLQEAGGLRSNSLEEPLLTASSDDMEREIQESSGAEESKEEAE